MKRANRTILCLALLLGSASLCSAETARIVTKENAIRQDCRFFAPVKAKVRYNDSVTIQGQSGDWFRVSFKGVKGCIHKSALEEKGFSLSGLGGSGAPVSSNEVSLAGKGFNPQVEASYKGRHPEMNFSTVDGIEKYQVSPEALQEFFEEGGLNQP